MALLESGLDVVVVDNFANSSIESIRRVEALTGRSITFVSADATALGELTSALDGIAFDAIIHLAGLKAIEESIREPARYFRQNLNTTLTLLELAQARGVTNFIFSSSATVYGEPQTDLISETHQIGQGLTNPYARSKLMSEQIIHDAGFAWPELKATILRYFNPVGAHPSARIGEDPFGEPNNLFPRVASVAGGQRDKLTVFGTDYATSDGTAIRDYIHVMDVAEGHRAALERDSPGTRVFNLGTGTGSSVFDVITTFERVSGRSIPYERADRRSGDLSRVIADPTRASTELGWRAHRTLEDACRDAWAWQSANPHGYRA